MLCTDGQWVQVEEILDTGEWEVVYNLRIADYHTYFVTDWDWGFSVWSHNVICGFTEGPTARSASYSRSGDVPATTDPANQILKNERIARSYVPAGSTNDNRTLAYLQIVGETHPPFFASNSDSYTYNWPSVQSGQLPTGQGVNNGARSHAEAKAMVRAVQTSGVTLTGKTLVIFTDRDPCQYCDKDRGIENAARILGATSVTVWCPSGKIGPINL